MRVFSTEILRRSRYALREYCRRSSSKPISFSRQGSFHSPWAPGNVWSAALQPNHASGVNAFHAKAPLSRGLSTILGQQAVHKLSKATYTTKWAKLTALGVGIPLVGLLTWSSLRGEDGLSQLRTLSLFAIRFSRDCWTVAAIAADYYRTLAGVPDGDARESLKRACHQRGADQLQQLFFANGGIYIKLGQHIGQLDYVLPDEYVLTMRRVMLDKCPESPFEDVARTFVDGFGRTPEQMFTSFNREPIASASLSQVHEAVSHDGQRLAVKVQHRWLRTGMVPADILTVEMLVGLVRWLFPAYDYRWLVEEVKRNLPMELNFVTEANNAARCEANFAATGTPGFPPGSVVVPKMFPQLSCSTVLTMEFVEGAPLTDTAAIRRMGLDPAEVADLLSAAFARMIFRHGFVHCDPHEANLLIRCLPPPSDGPAKGPLGQSSRCSRRRPQLVLLDHGLYRELDDALRISYAGLWQCLSGCGRGPVPTSSGRHHQASLGQHHPPLPGPPEHTGHGGGQAPAAGLRGTVPGAHRAAACRDAAGPAAATQDARLPARHQRRPGRQHLHHHGTGMCARFGGQSPGLQPLFFVARRVWTCANDSCCIGHMAGGNKIIFHEGSSLV
eukprot:jgi/Mesvir1/19519/Mv06895-RA.2